MSEKIVVPTLGESVTEATVSKWLKSQGEKVMADEPVVELETDKVNLEVPSPVSGILIKINSKDGSTVEVGALLGSVSENGAGSKKSEEIKVKSKCFSFGVVSSKIIDKINNNMGRDKLRIATQGFDRNWKMKQEQLSPCYTTRIDEILTIKI